MGRRNLVAFKRLQGAMSKILGHLVMLDAGLRAEDVVLVENGLPPGRNEPPALFANFAHMSLHRAVSSAIYGLHDPQAVAAGTFRRSGPA